MNFSYKDIFQVPERTILQRKLTKAFFLKNFDLTTNEKKVLNDVIVQMEWFASLKPTNCNVSAIINELISIEELQIMICNVGNENLEKLGVDCIQLFQKHIPYNMVVIVENDTEFKLNVCEKRINQNDKTKRIIEKEITTSAISKLYKTEVTASFFESLNFTKLDKTNLETLYQDYCNALIQFNSSSVTGVFQIKNTNRTKDDLILLNQIESLEKEITKLTNQLKTAKQLSQKVMLNITIQKNRKQLEEIKSKLSDL